MDVKLDFEIPKGYRLVRIGYPKTKEQYLATASCFDASTAKTSCFRILNASNDFYPMCENIRVIVEPVPPEVDPLEAKDITPGCVFRRKHWAETVWVYGEPTLKEVMFSDSNIFPVEYEKLKEEWMIKHLGGQWQECSKIKE